MDSLENTIIQHYGADDLLARIDAGLKSSGMDPARLTLEDLAPVDEFDEKRRNRLLAGSR